MLSFVADSISNWIQIAKVLSPHRTKSQGYQRVAENTFQFTNTYNMKISLVVLTIVAVAFAAPAPAPHANADAVEKRQGCGLCVNGRYSCCANGLCQWLEC